jgi:hypothetical protein
MSFRDVDAVPFRDVDAAPFRERRRHRVVWRRERHHGALPPGFAPPKANRVRAVAVALCAQQPPV